MDRPELQVLLQQYGHRNNIELAVAIPPWKLNPRYLPDLVNGYIDSRAYRQGLRRFREAQEKAEEAGRHILRHLRGYPFRW